MALSLACAGRRVLYCENPVSLLRNSARRLAEVDKNVYAFGLKFLGHRLNNNSILEHIQIRSLAAQIRKNVAKVDLRDPILIYPHGEGCLALSHEFKRRGFSLVHICMDYHLTEQIEHVRQSDLTLVIPLIAFRELRNMFGDKVRQIPQFGSRRRMGHKNEFKEARLLVNIPRPRLGYLGSVSGRVSTQLLGEILSQCPELQFISVGKNKVLPLANEHVIPWQDQSEISDIAGELDVGFMPYDCADPKNLHCVPLKLFDYFAQGIPVVSTPIVYVQEYADLVYLGTTAAELARAVSDALAEPPDSPKKARRKEIAKNHSIEGLSQLVVTTLDQLNR
jgi:hypothetical protein